MTGSGWPAECHAGDRKDMGRQFQKRGDLLDAVAYHADRTATKAQRLGRLDEKAHHQTGVDGTVENGVQMVVVERFAAHLADPPDAAAVGAENHHHRAGHDPIQGWDQFGHRRAFSGVAHNHHRRLLQIRFGRRRKGRR